MPQIVYLSIGFWLISRCGSKVKFSQLCKWSSAGSRFMASGTIQLIAPTAANKSASLAVSEKRDF